jgi:toxin ParE1/3/4
LGGPSGASCTASRGCTRADESFMSGIVRELPQVWRDLEEIATRIGIDNPSASLRFLEAAEDGFHFLAENRRAGTEFDPPVPNLPGVRFWPVTRFHNYLIIYRPLLDGVEIVRVLHGARDLRRALTEP